MYEIFLSILSSIFLFIFEKPPKLNCGRPFIGNYRYID